METRVVGRLLSDLFDCVVGGSRTLIFGGLHLHEGYAVPPVRWLRPELRPRTHKRYIRTQARNSHCVRVGREVGVVIDSKSTDGARILLRNLIRGDELHDSALVKLSECLHPEHGTHDVRDAHTLIAPSRYGCPREFPRC